MWTSQPETADNGYADNFILSHSNIILPILQFYNKHSFFEDLEYKFTIDPGISVGKETTIMSIDSDIE